MIDFSFVIPVYKTEKLLNRCLKSIKESFRGTNLSYEVLLVDDGNIPPLQNKEFNCEILRHDVNRSCFQARISGFKQARGRWILTVDPDDVLIRMEWYKIRNYLQSTDADILMFPQRRCFLPKFNSLLHRTLAKEVEYFSGDDLLKFYKERAGAWSITGKVFSANLVKKVVYFFSENKKEVYLNLSDDYALTSCFIFCANKLILSGGGLYLYCSRSGSLTNDGWLSDKFKINKNLNSYLISNYLVQDFLDSLSIESHKKGIMKRLAYETFNKIPDMLMPELAQSLTRFPDLWPKYNQVFSERVLIDTLGLEGAEGNRLYESDLLKLQALYSKRASFLIKLRPILVKLFPVNSLIGQFLRELYLYWKD